jgi:PAS domain S-box-containing protein
MDIQANAAIDYYFLQGKGEIAGLLRGYNWAEHALGQPDNWPHNLQVSLSIVLNSSIPMLLFWGDDFTCFYNDKLTGQIGTKNGAPLIGLAAKEVLAESWSLLKPTLEQVKDSGAPASFENVPLPFYRHNKGEATFWTVSYSPVYGAMGKIDGVLVICNETTTSVKANKKLNESDARFQQLVDDAAVGIVILNGPEMRIEVANDAYGKVIGKKANEIIGKPVFDVVPETEPYFREIIEQVSTSRQPLYLYDHPYFVYDQDDRKDGFLDLGVPTIQRL